jgi:hypothetical protein
MPHNQLVNRTTKLFASYKIGRWLPQSFNSSSTTIIFVVVFVSWLEFHFPSLKCQNLPHRNIYKQKDEKYQGKMFLEGCIIFFNAGLDAKHIIRNILKR